MPAPITRPADVRYQTGKLAAEKKAGMSLANYKAPKLKQAPTYRIPDQGKLKNIGVGWGGEKPVSPKQKALLKVR